MIWIRVYSRLYTEKRWESEIFTSVVWMDTLYPDLSKKYLNRPKVSKIPKKMVVYITKIYPHLSKLPEDIQNT